MIVWLGQSAPIKRYMLNKLNEILIEVTMLSASREIGPLIRHLQAKDDSNHLSLVIDKCAGLI